MNDSGLEDRELKETTRKQLENAYRPFIPWEYFRLMGRDSITDVVIDDVLEKNMTVLFSDIRNFTTISESLTPREIFRFLNSYFQPMESVIAAHGGIIDKYVGDEIMALFPDNADEALEAAVGMLRELVRFNERRKEAGHNPIEIGIGLNTGLMLLGTIGGGMRMSSTVVSDAVNLASRVQSITKEYSTCLLISEHTLYSLSNASAHQIRFTDRIRVKGKGQPQSIYEVFDADPLYMAEAKRRNLAIFEEALALYHFKDIPAAKKLLEKCLNECPEDGTAKTYLERCRRFMSTGIHTGTGEVDLSISWTEDLAIGDAIIDGQHRRLFNAVNNFVSDLRKSESLSKVQSLLNFLDEYIHEHFQYEERFMAKHQYPFIDIQKEQHERFSHYFSRLKDQIREDYSPKREFLLFRVQIIVMDWLVHHTSKQDRRFGRYLNMLKNS
ncbi:MAG: bacteriohemerythrin [Syntrophales bacterium]|nr:bacteriohemerythrin [Syntrophales bacterium]